MDLASLLPAVPQGSAQILLGLGAATFALVALTQGRRSSAETPHPAGDPVPEPAVPRTEASLAAQLRHPASAGSGLEQAPEAIARAITAIAGPRRADAEARGRTERHAWWETVAVGLMRDALAADDAPVPQTLAFLAESHPALLCALGAQGLSVRGPRVPLHVAPAGAGILNHWMAEDEVRRRIEKPFVETAFEAIRHRSPVA